MAQDAMKPPGGQKRSSKSLDTFTASQIAEVLDDDNLLNEDDASHQSENDQLDESKCLNLVCEEEDEKNNNNNNSDSN